MSEARCGPGDYCHICRNEDAAALRTYGPMGRFVGWTNICDLCARQIADDWNSRPREKGPHEKAADEFMDGPRR